MFCATEEINYNFRALGPSLGSNLTHIVTNGSCRKDNSLVITKAKTKLRMRALNKIASCILPPSDSTDCFNLHSANVRFYYCNFVIKSFPWSARNVKKGCICETSTPTEILYITKTRKIKNSPRPPSVSLFFRSSLQVVVRLVMYCWCIPLYSFDIWFFFFQLSFAYGPSISFCAEQAIDGGGPREWF